MMTSPIPDEAVREVYLALLGRPMTDQTIKAALLAALPHLMPSNAEINESMLEELKALRADIQPLLISANKGAARIKALEETLNHLISAAEDVFASESSNRFIVCKTCGGQEDIWDMDLMPELGRAIDVSRAVLEQT